MRFEYIEPFVDATVRVFQTILGPEVRRGDFALLRSDRLEADMAVVIGVTGESEGSVLLSMEMGTALRVGNVMNGRPAEATGEVDADALGELANIIAGNAASSLNDMGFEFHITPPVVVGRGGQPIPADDVEVFQIPIETNCGDITMNVLLRVN